MCVQPDTVLIKQMSLVHMKGSFFVDVLLQFLCSCYHVHSVSYTGTSCYCKKDFTYFLSVVVTNLMIILDL